MKFTLDAGGAQAAGQGIGNLVKAYMLGPQVRQQAEQDAMLSSVKMAQAEADAAIKETQLGYQKNPLESVMLRLGIPLDQRGAVNNRINTGSFGPQYDALPPDQAGPALPAPADSSTMSKLGEYLAMAQTMYGTGSKVDQASMAELNQQTGRIRDQALSNVGDVDTMNRLNTLAKPGETYMPFKTVGDTGATMNQATGQQAVVDQVLRKLFADESGAKVLRDKGAANSSNAAAGKYGAEAAQTKLESDILKSTGAKPGSGREASEGALSSTILSTLKVPALDAKGRPVRNPITGELETTVDLEAQKSFYQWANQNNRKPTATAFTQWEAQGRPGANKNPSQVAVSQKINAQDAITKAKDAIQNGAPRDKVIERLRQNGIDPTGL